MTNKNKPIVIKFRVTKKGNIFPAFFFFLEKHRLRDYCMESYIIDTAEIKAATTEGILSLTHENVEATLIAFAIIWLNIFMG